MSVGSDDFVSYLFETDFFFYCDYLKQFVQMKSIEMPERVKITALVTDSMQRAQKIVLQFELVASKQR